jgi:hypothetical protein
VFCSLAKKGPVPSPLSGRRASLLDFCEQIFLLQTNNYTRMVATICCFANL